jgi:hypothetical protein
MVQVVLRGKTPLTFVAPWMLLTPAGSLFAYRREGLERLATYRSGSWLGLDEQTVVGPPDFLPVDDELVALIDDREFDRDPDGYFCEYVANDQDAVWLRRLKSPRNVAVIEGARWAPTAASDLGAVMTFADGLPLVITTPALLPRSVQLVAYPRSRLSPLAI